MGRTKPTTQALLLRRLAPLALLVASLAPTPVSGQRTTSYQGDYPLGAHTAQADYNYYLLRGDSIAHGPLELSLTLPGEKAVQTWRWSGRYERDRHLGEWQVRSERLTPLVRIGTQDRRVLFSADGWEWTLSAPFRSGLPHGSWHLLRRRVAASLATDTLSQTRLGLNLGKLEGDARLEDQAAGLRAEGRFSAGGLFSGLWRFESRAGGDTLTEWIRFEQGAPEELWLLYGVDTLVHHRFRLPSDPATRQTVAFDSIALRALLYRMTLRQPLAPRLAAALEDHHAFLQSGLSLPFHDPELGSLWAGLPGEGFEVPQAMIVLTLYPIDASEAAALDSLAALTDELIARTDSLLKNPQFKLNRYGSRSLGLRYEALREIRRSAHRIDTLLTDLADPAMRYVDREALLEQRLSTLRYPKKLQVQTGDSLHMEPYTFPSLVFHESPLVALDEHLRECLEQTEQIQNESRKLLEALEVEQYILASETRMVALHDSVVGLFEGTLASESHCEFHARLNEPVQRFLAREFELYYKLEAKQKFEQADRLIACLMDLTHLHDTLALLPAQLDRMDKAYTRQAYNPYTYTYIGERVKERIYTAYRQKLVPYLLDQTSRSLDCSKIQTLSANFGLLDRQMLAWLGEDTRKIERKLRKSDNPEHLLKKLNLDLRF